MKFSYLFFIGVLVVLPTSFLLAQDQNNNTADTKNVIDYVSDEISVSLPLSGITNDPIVVPSDNDDDLLNRSFNTITPFNFVAYFVSLMVTAGLSVETIVLTLLIPILATIITFTRNIIGLPSMDTLVIISFSIALVASNILIGSILLVVTLVSSVVARSLFKRIKIMQLPKVTLSMFFVTVSVLSVLGLIALTDGMAVQSISVVPVLLFIIMSERIVRLQFDSNPNYAWMTVLVTLVIGTTGYYIMLSENIRQFLINYPETVFLVIPINYFIGRYFGLRLMEKVRFSDLLSRKK